MQTKPVLTKLTILLGLLALTIGSYALARLLPDFGADSAPGLPPLSRLRLPAQTADGLTVSLDSYYADASRLVFKIRVEGEGQSYGLDNLSLTNSENEELNTGYGLFSPADDPSIILLEMIPAYASTETRLDGQLSFSVMSPDASESSRFRFDLDVPIQPAQTWLFTLDGSFYSTVGDNEAAIYNSIYLERVVITPAFTWAYLCYDKPTDADWMIGLDSTLNINGQTIGVNTYSLLYDSSMGDGTKGGEPGWAPEGNFPRCIKAGFPLGSEINYPTKLTLTIPALEQSMPEVIPQKDLNAAYPKLRAQGIDMTWHIVDGGAYPEWKKIPEGMSEQEAMRKFIEALGYTFPGTWIIEIQLEPRDASIPVFSTSNNGASTPIPLSKDEPSFVFMDAHIQSFDVSRDGKTIALATSQGVILYDMETRQPLRTLGEKDGFFSSVKWSPEGDKLAAWNVLLRADGVGTPHLFVWNTNNWKTIFDLGSDQEVFIPFGALAWSPDGKMLATSYPERELVVISIGSGKIVSEQKDFLITPYDVEWSPDGSRLIATGDLGFGFRRWRVNTGETIRMYDSRAASAVGQLAWSPDGKRIASIHEYGTVCFWTVSTNDCDGFIQVHEYTSSLAWSPGAKRLATGGNAIRIWDTHTGGLLTSFGFNEEIYYSQMEWLSEHVLIVRETDYATSAALIRLWDVETGQALWEIRGTDGVAP